MIKPSTTAALQWILPRRGCGDRSNGAGEVGATAPVANRGGFERVSELGSGTFDKRVSIAELQELKSRRAPPLLLLEREQTASFLGTPDTFTRAMGPFDRAARLNVASTVSPREFLDFIRSTAVEWTPGERAKLRAWMDEISPRLLELGLPLPEIIRIGKTDGRGEAGEAHVRGDAGRAVIVLTSPAVTKEIFVHELFHAITRNSPDLAASLYRTIGFEKRNEIALPEEISSRRITNPDAPTVDVVIKIWRRTDSVDVAPVLFSKYSRFDPARHRDLFDGFRCKLMLVEADRDGQWQPRLQGGRPVFLDPQNQPDYLRQVGVANHPHAHPEEVMAENFVDLVLRPRAPANPEILARMEKAIANRLPPHAAVLGRDW